MLRQQEDLDGGMEGTIYGRKKDLDRILSSGVNINNIKEIYTFLLQDRIGTVDNLIKSRAESRNPQVVWKETWMNWSNLKAVTAEMKYFAWSLVQDILETPSRNHRGGKIKTARCLYIMLG